jgi:hypothetical protein
MSTIIPSAIAMPAGLPCRSSRRIGGCCTASTSACKSSRRENSKGQSDPTRSCRSCPTRLRGAWKCPTGRSACRCWRFRSGYGAGAAVHECHGDALAGYARGADTTCGRRAIAAECGAFPTDDVPDPFGVGIKILLRLSALVIALLIVLVNETGALMRLWVGVPGVSLFWHVLLPCAIASVLAWYAVRGTLRLRPRRTCAASSLSPAP